MKNKWIKIERGYRGRNQKWQYGERVFMCNCYIRSNFKWYFYELPNNNSGEEIFTHFGDFLPGLSKFKRFIETQS